MSVSACSIKTKKVDPKELDKVFSSAKEDRVEKLEAEISAIERKAEVLQKVHQYSPYIKMLNVYIPPSQRDDGTFVHEQIISVPLVFKTKEKSKIDPQVLEGIFKASKKDAKREAEQQKETAPLRPAVVTPRQETTIKTGSAKIIMK